MRTRPLGLLALVLFAPAARAEPDRVTGANYPQALKFNRDFVYQHVQEAAVFPQFIGKTDQFWYAVRTPNGTKYWRVDPARKMKDPLFDPARLAAQLSEAAQKPIDTDTLALTRVTVTEDGTKVRFVHADFQYEYELAAAKLTKLGKAPPPPRAFPKGDVDERTRLLMEKEREERERLEKEDDRKDEKKEDVKKEEKKDEKADPKKEPARPGFDYKAFSPDRKRYVFAQKHNLYLAEEGKEPEASQLTTDGEEDYSFSSFGGRVGTRTTDGKIPPADRKVRPFVTWSPDSKGFFVTRTDARGVRDLYLVDSLADPRPTLQKYKYPMPGEEAVFKSELFYCDAAARKIAKVKTKWPFERYGNIHWTKTADELRFVRRDRPQRHLEVCTLNTKTGEEKCLIADGFDAAFLDYQPLRYVDESDEMIWWSERSGWGHFYLYGRDGKPKNPITTGSWRASQIVDVDGKNRLLYFVGNGREAGENIYYTHLYRVRFDGTDLTLLDPSHVAAIFLNPTHGPTDTTFSDREPGCQGMNHTSYLSPSKRFIVTTCSRVDFPTMAYVLDEKGSPVMDLERTDVTALRKTGWRLPETFCVKAADGVTSLYGNMWKPFDFDPKRKYPVIAHVYPGPQQEGVAHTFSAYGNNQQLAQLGFVVVQVGHRGGTPARSKAYHSYGYYNLRDYALADKKAAIEQLAARHAFMDLDRVGIYGHSGGGFLSAAALLQKPFNDFFKVAVASAGNHDNNIYNDNWSERYHGLKEVPIDPKDEKGKAIPPSRPADDEEDDEAQDKKVEKTEEKKTEKMDDAKKVEDKTEDGPKTRYEIKVPTNAELAANLKGHLLLVHGEIDDNVHPANTMRLVDALIKANKRFDMLILPGKRHGFADYQPYFTQRMWDFFAEHLLEDRQTGPDVYQKAPGRK